MSPAGAVPYGSWPSPLTPAAVVARTVSLGEVRVGTDDVWWSELRPEEGGRVQVVRHRPGGATVDVLPEGMSARTRVHEYGGAAWWLHESSLFFVDDADQRLYRMEPDGSLLALTPQPAVPAGDRYADGVTTGDARWVICVRERHARPDDPEPTKNVLLNNAPANDVLLNDEPANELVAIRAHPGGVPEEPVVLVTGRDFVSSPRVSPDGTRLAWITWDHPRMPWDGTELWVATLLTDDGPPRILDARRVAGGPDESVMQPGWSSRGTLRFLSDRSDWWNLYEVDLSGAPAPDAPGPDGPEPSNLAPLAGEVGTPPWVFGQSRWCELADGRILVAYARDGFDHLGVSVPGRAPVPLAGPFTEISSLRAFGSGAVCVGGSPTAEAVVAVLDIPDVVAASPEQPPASPEAEVQATIVRPSRTLPVGADWISRPEPFAYPTADGATAHAFLYRPTNPEVRGPDGDRPPVLVTIHGGPTSAARSQLNPAVQYWTTRGFAVVDVNYRGSTGFGRRYRRALDGAWGVADVQDCIHAVRHLASVGIVDPERAAIRGGSAGGFTALLALCEGDTFRTGASLYGVTDLYALARETHKFESRYLDTLVGSLPEHEDRYTERSPLNRLDSLRSPLIVFQGSEDRVVPPAQAEAVVAALASRSVPHAYLLFEGEQHGFRRAENIALVLEAELYFYGRVLGFEPADDLEPVPIEGG